MSAILLSLALVLYIQPQPEPGTSKPRELSVPAWSAPEDAKFAPVVVRSKPELEKAIDRKEVRDEILKAVKLDQEYLVVFAWSGSGGDRLAFEVVKGAKGAEVVFKRRPGLTDDLRAHRKVFAIPKTMTHRLAE
jgi:type III secretion system FlhB-like substrate exporter